MPSKRSELNRRELLGLGVAGGLSLGLPVRAIAQTQAGDRPKSAEGAPKNIIFMIADGMSLGVPSLAEPFSRRVRGTGTTLAEFLSDAGASRGFFETHSLNSLVTDSSAAASAYGGGSRVFNGAVNVLPNGDKLTPIARLAKDVGKRVGLVTTTQITHATPAGFASAVKSRDEQYEIAAQYLNVVDVLMGGGVEHYQKDARPDGRDLIAEHQQAGYVFGDSRADLRSLASNEKILALFGGGHLPLTLDWRGDDGLQQRVPTLAEMTEAALRSLSAGDKGFLLQVEGGRVDHAAHANDAAGALWDQLAFDDAIRVAWDFARNVGDTLVVITADHGNANPGLNGMGGSYADSTKCFELVQQATMSHERLSGVFGGAKNADGVIKPEDVIEIARTHIGVTLAENEAAEAAQALSGDSSFEPSGQHRNSFGVFGQLVGNHTGVGWTGMSHTADMVMLTAFGPGADRFAGVLKNTDAFAIMTDLWGIRFRNRAMAPQEAAAYAALAPRVREPHWA